MLDPAWFEARRDLAEAKVAEAWREYLRDLQAANEDLSIAARSDELEGVRGIEEGTQRLGSRLQALYLLLAYSTAEALGTLFDPTIWRVAVDMRDGASRFAARMAADQRAALRAARDFGRKTSNDRARQLMFLALGLTLEQVRNVARYWALLDSSEDVVGGQNGPSVATNMAQANAGKALGVRTGLVAQVEGTRAVYQAAEEVLRQMIGQGVMDSSDLERVWWTANDERVRHSHAPMHGQVRAGLDSTFTTGGGVKLRFPCDPGGPIREIAGCRCGLEVRVRRA